MKTNKRDILISKINALDGLTPDEKAQITEYIREKTFGLVWENKPEKAEDVLKESLPVFEEVPERRIFNGEQYPNHIIIEGDNLHALTALRYTHERKIDVIYIDPPYNTGNKDFVYNDSFVDKEDGFRHSKWLSFMEKRLTIAKELLSDKGVIFVSIDDNEMAECKLLLEKIYGGGNFVECFCWKKTETPANLSLKSKKAIEYIYCFTKQPNTIKFQGLKKESPSSNGLMNQTNAEKELVFPPNVVHTKLRNGVYSKGKYGTKSYSIDLLEDTEVKDGLFVAPVKLFGKFKWKQDNLENEIAKGTVISIMTEAFSPSYEKREYEPEVPWNYIDKSFGVGTNETASTELKDIFNDKVFNYPKPCSLIRYLINFLPNKSATVLDFFAGSGTTLHAAMLLNEEDGGHRQCILVTNNENQICENVTYERNRRVINGYPDPKGQMVMGLHANNLRYYRTAFVSQDRTRQNKLRLVRLAVDLLCIKEDVYEEQSSFFSIENINKEDFRYFSENGKRLLVIFNEDIITQIVDTIKMADFEGVVKIYGFSPDSDFYSDEFSDINDRVKICALPAAIYNAYRNIIKRAKESEPYTDDVEPVGTPYLQSQQPTLDL